MTKLYFSNSDNFKIMIVENTAKQDFDNEFSFDFLSTSGPILLEKIKTKLQNLGHPFKKGNVKVFRNGVLIFSAFITAGCSINNEIANIPNNPTTIVENHIDNHNQSDSIDQITLVDNDLIEATIENDTPKITETIGEDRIEIVETPPEVNIEKSIFVSVQRSSGALEVLDLETYIVGVVAAEMPASFNIEALKAQAVASRTYTLKRIELGLVMTDTVTTQKYSDQSQLKNLWGKNYDLYYQKILSAVKDTNDIVMSYNGGLIDAVYHSTSNGATEDSSYVWGASVPYLKSVSSPTDIQASTYQKDLTLTYSEMTQKLGTTINANTSIEVLSRTANNSVNKIKINDKIFSGVEIRSKLSLRSTDFTIVKNTNNVTITMKGFGHGVGMSQYGAHGMANEGKSYRQILTHYYSNIELIKYY